MPDYPKIRPLADVLREQRQKPTAPKPAPKPPAVPMVTVHDAVAQIGGGRTAYRRLLGKCQRGEIPGAVRRAYRWLIPVAIVPSLGQLQCSRWTRDADDAVMASGGQGLDELAVKIKRPVRMVRERWLKLTIEQREVQEGDLNFPAIARALGINRETVEGWQRYGLTMRLATDGETRVKVIDRPSLLQFLHTRPDLWRIGKVDLDYCTTIGLDVRPAIDAALKVASKGIVCPHCKPEIRVWVQLYALNTRCPECSQRISAVVDSPVFSAHREVNMRTRAQRACLRELAIESHLGGSELASRIGEKVGNTWHALRELVVDGAVVKVGQLYRLKGEGNE